jgi:hypothetical protein
MDLNSILEKTKHQVDKITIVRKPIDIATEDRPYQSSPPDDLIKPATNWQQN